jgi:asparagine synthase (glutamine-hydrolysing)
MRMPIRFRFQADVRQQLNGHVPEARIWNAFGVPGRDALRGMIAADIDVLLPDDFLTKVDRASMAFGLEVRPPMVDHEFLELASRIPSSLKVRAGKTKWIFKRMCHDWLPNDIVHRPKQGFELPIDEWLRGPLRDAFTDSVLSTSSRVAEYLDPKQIVQLMTAHQRSTGRYGHMLWSILVLGAWMESYLRPLEKTSEDHAL